MPVGENPLAADLARELNRQVRLRLLGERRMAHLCGANSISGKTVKNRTRIPNLSRIDQLMSQIEALPAGRRLTVGQVRAYRGTVVRIYRALLQYRWEVQRLQHRARQEAYEARIGRFFLDSPDAVLEDFLLGRRNRDGGNVHAAALARRRRATPDQLSDWGRSGARARWGKHRGLATEAETTASHPAAWPNEHQAASVRGSV